LRQAACERHQHDEERHDKHDHALDCRRDPERQEAMQKAGAEADMPVRSRGHRQVDRLYVRKFAGRLEDALFAVYLAAASYSRVTSAGEVLACREHRFGADHLHVLMRNVEAEVDRPAWQAEAGDERKAPRIGIRTLEVHQREGSSRSACSMRLVRAPPTNSTASTPPERNASIAARRPSQR